MSQIDARSAILSDDGSLASLDAGDVLDRDPKHYNAWARDPAPLAKELGLEAPTLEDKTRAARYAEVAPFAAIEVPSEDWPLEDRTAATRVLAQYRCYLRVAADLNLDRLLAGLARTAFSDTQQRICAECVWSMVSEDCGEATESARACSYHLRKQVQNSC